MKNQVVILVMFFSFFVVANTAYSQPDNYDTVLDLLKKITMPGEITDPLWWQLKSKAQASLIAMGEDAVETLLWIANDEVQPMRIKLFALGALAEMRCKEAMPIIIKHLSSQSETVRWDAIECLGILGTEEAVKLLLDIAENGLKVENSGMADIYAIEAIQKVINPTATAELKKALKSENNNVVGAVQKALANIPTKEAFEALATTLSDKRYGVRKTAAVVLSTVPMRESIELLKNALKAEKENEYMQLELALSLTKLGDGTSGKILRELAVNGSELDVRGRAVDALAEVSDTSAVPLIMKFLNEESTIRAHAVCALGKLGDASVVPALEKIAKDDRIEPLREAARASIEQIKARVDSN